MPAARLPADEVQRLWALRRAGLIDRPADPRLDAIVQRAAALLDVPIAAVTLLDQTRQVFRSSVGLGVPHMRRDHAFCGHTILDPDPLVVLDATQDERFCDNPMVSGPTGLRFYAGIPVTGQGGMAFGALCVMDMQARTELPPAVVDALQVLADEVSAILSQPSGPEQA